MTNQSSHPCDTGDLPYEVLFRCFANLLPLNAATVRKNWRERYPFFVRRKTGLCVDVKAADVWFDQRGERLFSQALLDHKRSKNPGWVPAGDVSKEGATTLPAMAPTKATEVDSAGETGEIGDAA
jgi:hypothetical protein